MIAQPESSPEKAGVGGSIPSLATTFSNTYRPSTPGFGSNWFQFQPADQVNAGEAFPSVGTLVNPFSQLFLLPHVCPNMNALIPVYHADGSLYAWASEQRLARLQSAGLRLLLGNGGPLGRANSDRHLQPFGKRSMPNAALVQGIDGSLYGTTTSGGAYGFGTVFGVTTAGALTTIYSFPQAANPNGLIQAVNRNLYTERGHRHLR